MARSSTTPRPLRRDLPRMDSPVGRRALALFAVTVIFSPGFHIRAQVPPPPPETPATPTPEPVRGRWVLDAGGRPVPSRPGRRERGLQTSGLVLRDGILWSLGDQRSEYPGHLLRIDPSTGHLRGSPVRLDLDPEAEAGKRPLFEAYRSIPNPDFEGLTRHPTREDGLLAVTEDKEQWLVDIRLDRASPGATSETGGPRARIVEITPLEFDATVRPFRDSPNYRLEGITLSTDSSTVYLAYERLHDDLPRIFRLPAAAATAGTTIRPRLVEVDFAAVPLRADKPRARLNLNGLATLPLEDGGERLVAIARDQERVLTIDPVTGRVERIVDLVLRAPDGAPMLWVSPEAIALDTKTRRLWVISDPDSIQGNYRKLEEETAGGPFADLVPLLFELPLDGIVPRR